MELPANAVFLAGTEVVTTSLLVAEMFEKEHFNVMKDIRELLAQMPESHVTQEALNFECLEYESHNNLGYAVKLPYYRITRRGFYLLCMGYKGEKALRFKLALLDEFERLSNPITPPLLAGLTSAVMEYNRALGLFSELYDPVLARVKALAYVSHKTGYKLNLLGLDIGELK